MYMQVLGANNLVDLRVSMGWPYLRKPVPISKLEAGLNPKAVVKTRRGRAKVKLQALVYDTIPPCSHT